MPLVIARRFRLSIFGWGLPAPRHRSTVAQLREPPNLSALPDAAPSQMLEPDLFVGGDTELERFIHCVRAVHPFELG